MTNQPHPNDPIVNKLPDGSMHVTLTNPMTPAKLRRAAFLMENLASSIEESCCPHHQEEGDQEDPGLAAAAVLDDVRAVLLGRGREHGYANQIVDLISLPGGSMGLSVSRKDEQAVVTIAFGATGNRADMRERLALDPGAQVPPLSYVETTDFDREGIEHLLSAVKLAYPDLLEAAPEE